MLADERLLLTQAANERDILVLSVPALLQRSTRMKEPQLGVKITGLQRSGEWKYDVGVHAISLVKYSVSQVKQTV